MIETSNKDFQKDSAFIYNLHIFFLFIFDFFLKYAQVQSNKKKSKKNLDNPFVAELTQNNAVGSRLQIYVGLTLRNTNQ